MRGSIQWKIGKNKKRTYYAVLYLSGRQKWEKIGAVTRYEADRYLRKRLEELERNFARDLKKATFAELAKEWLESLKVDKKPHTLKSYGFQVNHDLVPFFGKMICSKILPEHIEKFKRQTREKVSATTTNYDLRILRQILDVGIRWGYLYTNPAKLVKKLKQERPEFKALTREEVGRLLQVAEPLPCFIPGQPKVLLMTAVMSGLREGEILAMKWKNLNLPAATYNVKESFNEYGFDVPKTGASIRTVTLSRTVLEELRQHKIRQNEFRLAAGNLWKHHDLIFTSEAGTPIDPSNLRKLFRHAREKAGLPKTIRFHDLRGTAATLALESGATVKAVQNLLGHSTPNLTLSVYAKVTEASQKDLADRVDAYLFNR